MTVNQLIEQLQALSDEVRQYNVACVVRVCIGYDGGGGDYDSISHNIQDVRVRTGRKDVELV